MAKEKTFIYGGTFDPPHQGHLELIETLLGNEGRIVIAPTTQNPFKKNQATPLHIRLEMIEAALNSKRIAFTTKLNERTSKKMFLSNFPYTYACDFVDWWRSFDNSELYWVVASDIEHEVETWKRWNELGVKKFVVPIVSDVSSSDIRNGNTDAIAAVALVIKKYDLY